MLLDAAKKNLESRCDGDGESSVDQNDRLYILKNQEVKLLKVYHLNEILNFMFDNVFSLSFKFTNVRYSSL